MRKQFLATVVTALVALVSVPAQAAYVLESQDVDFTFVKVDDDTFTLRIQGALSPSGDWDTAVALDNLAFKDIGNFTSATMTPGNWTENGRELNANGCLGGDSGGLCFDASPAFTLSDDMLFTINVIGGTFEFGALGPHLKLRFLDAGGNKEGSLLSEYMSGVIPDPQCTNCNPTPVPEPETYALMLAGLGAMAYVRRRRLNPHMATA